MPPVPPDDAAIAAACRRALAERQPQSPEDLALLIGCRARDVVATLHRRPSDFRRCAPTAGDPRRHWFWELGIAPVLQRALGRAKLDPTPATLTTAATLADRIVALLEQRSDDGLGGATPAYLAEQLTSADAAVRAACHDDDRLAIRHLYDDYEVCVLDLPVDA